MGWFDGFRDEGRNTYYPRQRAAVVFDLSLIFVIVFCVIIIVALLIVIVGTRGKERWSTFLRVVFTLHTGLVIFLVQFGQEWQIAQAITRCPYTTEDMEGLEADIHVKVGLRCVNVTLAGTLEKEFARGEVSYNERFWFVGVHEIQEEFETAKQEGLPQAILYILEYFSIDDGDVRWMRAIRLGGHFAFILLWSALAAWILANIMLCFEVSRGSLTFVLAGVLMVLACVVYNHMQPFTPLMIPFEDAYIDFHYGWCFWLCLTSGTMAVVTGLTIWIAHMFYPVGVGLMFLLDTTHLEEEQDRVVEVEPLNCGDLPIKSISSPNFFENGAFDNDATPHGKSAYHRRASRLENSEKRPFEFSSRFSPCASAPSGLAQLAATPSVVCLEEVPENCYDNACFDNEDGDVINIIADSDSDIIPKEAPPAYVKVTSGAVTTVDVLIENNTPPEENQETVPETVVHRL